MKRRPAAANILKAGVFALALLLVFATGMLSYRQGEKLGIRRLQTEANHRLDLFASAVEGVVKPLENIPATIQLHPDVLEILRTPGTLHATAAVNDYLRRLNAHVGGLAAFTLNVRGVVVASSNTAVHDDSLLGTDVSFRPYFLDALAGRVGKHFSIGIDGGSAGYFVSYPVRDGAVVVGVAVIKIGLHAVDQLWDMVGSPALIADANQVVILASRPDWQYRAILPLGVEQRVDLQLTRAYSDLQILPIHDFPATGSDVDVRIDGQRMTLTRPLDGMDWRVSIVLDLQQVHREATRAAITGGGAATLLLLLALAAGQWRRIARQRRLVRRMLEQSNVALESKVAERTHDLRAINDQLRREVHDRNVAEQSLRAAQSELVQAGKMAVLGQLSAGITHELTQPLGAMRTIAGNAEEFLLRGKLDSATQNLKIIGRLVDQMGGIIQPLKNFARKSEPVFQKVDLSQSLDDALFLLSSRIRTLQVDIVNPIGKGRFLVLCEQNRLEQVLINLLSNSLDALEEQAPPRVIAVEAVRDSAEGGGRPMTAISVSDNGSGMDEATRARLFEPFFTTKESGAGLGLGLVISRDILTEFGGTIEIVSTQGRGTCFRLRIPSYEP